jgi:MATE family multidrug resistance protein
MGRALRVPTGREVRDVARLALPIVIVQVGMMLMGVVDSAMVGRYSAEGLGAVALGNLYWFGVVSIGQGTLMALDPLVAQAVGAHDRPAVARALQRGLLLSVVIAIPTALALLPGESLFTVLGQPPEVVPLAAAYARASIPGVLPFLAFMVLRQTLQAFTLVRPVVIAVVVANLANVVVDWGLIFGRLGLPELGAVGAGWASTICRILMAVMVLVAGRRVLVPYLREWTREDLALVPLWRMLRLGFPIGLQLWIEVAAFSAAMLLVGRLGALPLAGHQIALTLAALTYMVPLGVSQAAAVLVGQAIGRGDTDAARREGSAALACGVGFMATTAIVLVGAPQLLARAFTADAAIIAAAAALIPIAGVFQVFDGTQGVASGILRGAGDTRVPMWCNLAGYLLVGLPLGAWLCFARGWGATGIWWGLVAGLAAVAALLGWRVHAIIGGELRRLAVSGAEAR